MGFKLGKRASRAVGGGGGGAEPAQLEAQDQVGNGGLLDRIGDWGHDLVEGGESILEHAVEGIGDFFHFDWARDPEEQRASVPEAAPVAPEEVIPPSYPGADGSTEDKHAYYTYVVEQMGYGEALPEEGKKMLLATRGLTPDNMGSLDVDNTKNQFNDGFVVLGSDEEGSPFVSEYTGSVDPGTAGTDALQPGQYEYAYEGESFSSLNGYTVDGAYARMTKESAEQFDVVHDSNGDNEYDPEVDDVVTETNNRHYLMHFGGERSEGSVGGWSIGCQIVPGRDADGNKQMDKMMDDLGRDEAFTQVLLNGSDVADTLGGTEPGQS